MAISRTVVLEPFLAPHLLPTHEDTRRGSPHGSPPCYDSSGLLCRYVGGVLLPYDHVYARRWSSRQLPHELTDSLVGTQQYYLYASW